MSKVPPVKDELHLLNYANYQYEYNKTTGKVTPMNTLFNGRMTTTADQYRHIPDILGSLGKSNWTSVPLQNSMYNSVMTYGAPKMPDLPEEFLRVMTKAGTASGIRLNKEEIEALMKSIQK